MEGENKPWKLGYPSTGSYNHGPPATAAKGTWTTPSPPTGQATHTEEGGVRSKIHKLVPLGDGLGQWQLRGNVRGSSVAPKMREPPVTVTQMFDPKPRNDPVRMTRYYGAEVVKASPSSTKGKQARTPRLDFHAQPSLMLHGTRIGNYFTLRL